MIDPREHLASVARFVAEITAALDRGDVPSLADARLLRANAEVIELEVGRRVLESLPWRTPEQNKASQFAVDANGRRL